VFINLTARASAPKGGMDFQPKSAPATIAQKAQPATACDTRHKVAKVESNQGPPAPAGGFSQNSFSNRRSWNRAAELGRSFHRSRGCTWFLKVDGQLQHRRSLAFREERDQNIASVRKFDRIMVLMGDV